MKCYRKKPVVVEAIQLTPELALQCLVDRQPGPFGLHVSGSFHSERREVHGAWITMSSTMRAELNDWIIRDPAGAIYPCEESVFSKFYEVVEV